MTRIDFYVLTAHEEVARERFCCRLAEKAYLQGHRVYIHGRDAQQVERLDQLLWTFREGSFVPHEAYGQGSQAPVLLGFDQQPQDEHDVLINLADETPLFFSQFARLAELTTQQEEVAVPARKRFKFYRDRGYPLNHHSIDG